MPNPRPPQRVICPGSGDVALSVVRRANQRRAFDKQKALLLADASQLIKYVWVHKLSYSQMPLAWLQILA
jgi:hypothetical protein